MKKLRQLTPQDVMFVGGERANVYQHTMGVIVLDGRGRAGFGYESFRRRLEPRLARIPQFRWKLHEVPLGLDLPYWVEDENFSFDRHIRRMALPSPGDDELLSDAISYVYCKHLDRSKPLWEIWFVEGLAEGRFAVLQKMHHCMMDGSGAAKLFEFMWDLTPDAAPRALDPVIAKARPGGVPDLWQQSMNAASRLAGLPMKIGQEIYGAAWRSVSRRLSSDEVVQPRPTAPPTVFNSDISGERGFVFGALSLSDIKTVRQHFGVTVNDVVLAAVGGSLRDYLSSRGALPDESLRTSIAVSLRTDQDDNFSNKVTTASVTLATDLADPVERLRAIAAEADRAKEEAHRGEKGVMEYVQLLPPVLVSAIMSAAPAEQVPRLAGVNVVVSNVRGSAVPMYASGARVVGVYPMSILAPGGGINITCISYADAIHFGVTIEPKLVPEPWRIIEGLQKALREYLSLAGKAARRGGGSTRKSAGGKGKRAAPAKKAAVSRKSSRGGKAARRGGTGR